MNVDLALERRDFVRIAVETGRLPRAKEALREAMDLRGEREHRRLDLLAAIDSTLPVQRPFR